MSSIAPSASTTSDLLTWKDPIKTGKIFGSIVAVLVSIKAINLLNIFFYFAFVGLILSAGAEYAGKLVTGQGFVTKYKPSTKSYASTVKESVLPAVGDAVTALEADIHSIIYSHDIETTLKAAGLSYVFYKLTSWFSLFTLIATSVVLLFTVPVVYTKNKKEIDAAVAQYTKLAKDKTSEYSKLAQDKAAPHVEKLVQKSGPVGSFIKSKFPTRTAGSTVGDSTFEEPTSATSTGISTGSTGATTTSKFPEVPTESLKDDSTFEDLVDEAKSAAAKAQKEF